MKKIMFKDRFGLTDAVLSGKKTMTRRILKCPKKFKGVEDFELEFHKRIGQDFYYDCVVVDGNGYELGQLPLPYEIGDVVAIAQSYHSLNKSGFVAPEWCEHTCESSFGYKNKMYVKAELMPHHIRITDLWFERLQDISDEDAMKEGVFMYENPPLHHEYDRYAPWPPYIKPYKHELDNLKYFCAPQYAFKYLIEKVCGGGTWDSNPWVVAYTFELVD